MIRWDGCDAAIVGVASRCSQPDLLVYDYDKLVAVFAPDMGEEGAQEWVDFNIAGAWVGPGTPLILYPYDPDAPDED